MASTLSEAELSIHLQMTLHVMLCSNLLFTFFDFFAMALLSRWNPWRRVEIARKCERFVFVSLLCFSFSNAIALLLRLVLINYISTSLFHKALVPMAIWNVLGLAFVMVGLARATHVNLQNTFPNHYSLIFKAILPAFFIFPIMNIYYLFRFLSLVDPVRFDKFVYHSSLQL